MEWEQRKTKTTWNMCRLFKAAPAWDATNVELKLSQSNLRPVSHNFEICNLYIFPDWNTPHIYICILRGTTDHFCNQLKWLMNFFRYSSLYMNCNGFYVCVFFFIFWETLLTSWPIIQFFTYWSVGFEKKRFQIDFQFFFRLFFLFNFFLCDKES